MNCETSATLAQATDCGPGTKTLKPKYGERSRLCTTGTVLFVIRCWKREKEGGRRERERGKEEGGEGERKGERGGVREGEREEEREGKWREAVRERGRQGRREGGREGEDVMGFR